MLRERQLAKVVERWLLKLGGGGGGGGGAGRRKADSMDGGARGEPG